MGETTPTNISKVVVGNHTIKLTKFGYDDEIRNVSVSVGETHYLHVKLTGYGSLRISTYPSGAKVYLDGDYKGKTPLDISEVVVGSYSIKLTKRLYADVEKKIDVSAGETTSVSEPLSLSIWVSLLLEYIPEILIAIIAIGGSAIIYIFKNKLRKLVEILREYIKKSRNTLKNFIQKQKPIGPEVGAQKIEEYSAKMEEWEKEGYDVSELKEVLEWKK